ncbi:helix-turn-helix domain-containing protein [Acidocella sp.]|uniref:helix-turn-helix domain-containing protein n=1 Tax=Acidocella sp. TaxID=50710 RepID=UPI003D046E8E
MPDNSTGTETIEQEAISPAARVGAGLREVRERLGWKLPEVAEGLRIRPEFISAMESGNLSSLPGPAYRAGFVRSYAQALGLDGEEILRRFREAGQMGETPKAEIQFLAPVPDRGVPKGAIVLIGIVVVVAGYIFWYHHTEQQRRLAQSVPQVPAELQPLATPPKVVPPAPQASSPPAQAQPAPPEQATATAQAQTQTPPDESGGAPAAAPAQPATASQPSPTPAPAASATPVPPTGAAASAAPPPGAPGAGMVISATQDAWVQVTDSSGNILFSKVLHAGESWPVPQEAGLKMTTGNAGGTVIVTDGTAGQPLGAEGVVLRGYQLTPAASGTAPAAAATPSPNTGNTGTTGSTGTAP